MKKILGIIALCAMLIGGATIAKVYANPEPEPEPTPMPEYSCSTVGNYSCTLKCYYNDQPVVCAVNYNTFAINVQYKCKNSKGDITSGQIYCGAKDGQEKRSSLYGKCGDWYLIEYSATKCE
ncbi:MAG: hypothetical protein MJZ75_02435 [Paludibacteraceae bacterium]|nr:hypothetical protein [Paludibacteraceae bacterium]